MLDSRQLRQRRSPRGPPHHRPGCGPRGIQQHGGVAQLRGRLGAGLHPQKPARGRCLQDRHGLDPSCSGPLVTNNCPTVYARRGVHASTSVGVHASHEHCCNQPRPSAPSTRLGIAHDGLKAHKMALMPTGQARGVSECGRGKESAR